MKEFKEIETTKENGETKMNMKETSKKAAKKVKTICISLVVGIVIGAVGGINIYNSMTKTEVTNDYISGKLEDVGELATQQVTYSSTEQMEVFRLLIRKVF